MGNLQKKIILPLTKPKSALEYEEFYLGDFIEKLLLFDEVIVKSQRLNEIGYLINNFGLDSTINLLKSRSIIFHDQILQIGSFKIDNAYLIGKCRFEIVTTDHNHHLKRSLQLINDTTDLTSGEFKKLEKYLVPLVNHYEDQAHINHFVQFNNDITYNTRTVKQSLSNKIFQDRNVSVEPEKIEFNIEKLSSENNEYRFDTNIHHFLDLTAKEKHSIVLQSLLSFDSMNQRFLEMQNYNSLSGFKDNELNIVDEKIKFLLSSVNNKADQENFRRVINLADLPDFNKILSEEINLNQLLEIRNSEELIRFREWLSEINDASDEEIEEMITSYRIKVGNFISTKIGKGLRFIFSTTPDFIIPGLGVTIGAVDTFLLEKILPNNSAISFLNNKLPSILDNKTNV